ncbi:FAD-binding oxidoreductase [Saccharothrix lopnurensis]|uniref:FAD-binding oxidoreductase n=1 Tax=Saccharothrix lopnurensis TaxID=1670621 RepID=A0ABW1PDG2_9PSEU
MATGTLLGGAASADAEPRAVAGGEERAATIAAGDPRYDAFLRGDNHRFVGRPDHVRVATSTRQVVDAVSEAVARGRRIAVRSGGHGWEDFTTSSDIKVLLDLSLMDQVQFDRSKRAFSIEPGTTLGEAYRSLYSRWGVAFPGGDCPEVGVGGHIVGGGHGPLSRRFGATVDYLHAVEVVVVDRSGRARAVVASRDRHDPNRELWWAHTGGGGGNFGIVTKYWLRDPDVASADPTALLPKPPARWLVGDLMWRWDSLTEQAFHALVREHGAWFERNSSAHSPYANLSGWLVLGHRAGGFVSLTAMIDDSLPDAAGLLNAHFGEITARMGVAPVVDRRQSVPWLYRMTYPGAGKWGDRDTRRYKAKSAFLRKAYSDGQISTLYRYLDGAAPANPNALVILLPAGGRVNSVPAGATAMAHRGSVLKMICGASWRTEAEDAANLAWVRGLYRDLYADSGGVPVPGEASEGAYINYADADLADPVWNASGAPWTSLYYQGNYPRLQAVKKRWDPRDVFRHALSVRLPD